MANELDANMTARNTGANNVLKDTIFGRKNDMKATLRYSLRPEVLQDREASFYLPLIQHVRDVRNKYGSDVPRRSNHVSRPYLVIELEKSTPLCSDIPLLDPPFL